LNNGFFQMETKACCGRDYRARQDDAPPRISARRASALTISSAFPRAREAAPSGAPNPARALDRAAADFLFGELPRRPSYGVAFANTPMATARTARCLKTPPVEVRRNEHRLGSRVIERAAAQLAGSFDPDLIVSAIASALAGPSLSAIQENLAKAQNRAADVLASLYLPQLPTRHEIVSRAMAMFAETPSMDAIVSRAHTVILDAIGARLSALALQTNPAAAGS